jgi:RHS repeat-associated protein
LIAYRDSGTLRYVFSDHLVSSTVTADVNGGNVTRQLFKAWGENRSSGSLGTKYQFTGQYNYTSNFGQHFYRSRWYDSSLGRWAQADSIVPSNQGVQGLDRYAYVNNAPVRWNDPSGHCFILCTAAIGAAIGAVVGAVTYTAANVNNFNSGQMLVAAAGGAVAGALIGSGIGLVAGATTAAAAAATTSTASALISSGAAATVASESTIIQTAGNFNTGSYIISTAAAGVDGYITSGLSFFPAAGAKAALGMTTYMATAQAPTPEGLLASAGAGIAGAVIDSGLGLVKTSFLDERVLMPNTFANSAAQGLQEVARPQRIQNAIGVFGGGVISSIGTDFVTITAQQLAK